MVLPHFCGEFKTAVSSHLATCVECKESLTAVLTFLKTELPFFGLITKKLNLDEFIQEFLGKGKPHG